jgi:hypothetical protein
MGVAGSGLALQTADEAAEGNIVIKGTVSQSCVAKSHREQELDWKNLVCGSA